MISKLKFYLSLIIARCAYIGIRLLNKSSGTSFVGMLVLKICPDFLKYCSKYIKKRIITITGTNGKSTTSGLIAHILETAHQKVVHNLKGANMLTGVANVFALSIAPLKRYDYAVIESDEAYLTKLYDYMKSDYLVVTNLFRDQLDRYGELNTTAEFIKNAIDKNPDLKLILNADDPIVATFDRTKYAVYYGFENVEYDCSYEHKSNAPTEVFNCMCGEELKYSKQFFAQQGHYYCPKCGYKRHECNYSADVKVYNDYSVLTVRNRGISFEFKVNLAGLYNAYNALAAISLGFEAGMNQEEIQKSLDTYHAIFGRTEKRTINGNPAVIQLIKNPTGASEVLKTVDLKSNIVIAINDNYADGRDISWLWDSDFEQLKNAEKLVITSGCRANDMATRLKYAGIPQEKIIVEPNIKKAIDKATTAGKTTILPSYTALLKINKEHLKK
jgi:lipid II isoglutaminyl synthase (glutamine-hydrolysing)